MIKKQRQMQIKQIAKCADIMDDPFKEPYSPTTARGAKIPIIITKGNKNENAAPINIIKMGEQELITSE